MQRDYQGSIVAISDASGAVLEKRIFDAWGAIAKVEDGAGNVLAGLTILDRGYTGHEHLQSVGLIHMNGRLYDAKLHRFLQPDNYVQDSFNTQNYNRYGYCINNPLKYTDINGEWFGIDDAIAGAYIGGPITSDYSSTIFTTFKSGAQNSVRIALSTSNHALAVQSVTKVDILKMSGRLVTKYFYNVMDPAYGASKTISTSLVKNIFIIR